MAFWVLIVRRITSFEFSHSEDGHNMYLRNVGKKHIILHDVIIQKTTTEEAAPSKPKQSVFKITPKFQFSMTPEGAKKTCLRNVRTRLIHYIAQ